MDATHTSRATRPSPEIQGERCSSWVMHDKQKRKPPPANKQCPLFEGMCLWGPYSGLVSGLLPAPLSAGGREPGQGRQTGKGGDRCCWGALQEAGCRGSVQEPRGCRHTGTNNWEINFKAPFISFICRILNNSNSQEQRERWLPGGSPGQWGEGGKRSAGRWVTPEDQT